MGRAVLGPVIDNVCNSVLVQMVELHEQLARDVAHCVLRRRLALRARLGVRFGLYRPDVAGLELGERLGQQDWRGRARRAREPPMRQRRLGAYPLLRVVLEQLAAEVLPVLAQRGDKIPPRVLRELRDLGVVWQRFVALRVS